MLSCYEMVGISHFLRYRASGATWHDQVAATWQVVRATHEMRRCGITRAPKSKCASDTWQDSNTSLKFETSQINEG